MGAKDPQAALAAQSSLAKPAVEKAVAYSRSIYEITSETQQELAKMVEAQFGDFQKSMASMVELAAKSAPAGSEGAVCCHPERHRCCQLRFRQHEHHGQAVC